MKRIVVTGTPGSGKTTLARCLARQLDAPHVELATIYWDAGWQPAPAEEFRERVLQPAPAEEFRERVLQATQGERWVIDGLYHKELTWAAADTLVWLDYPLCLVLRRLLRRTAERVRAGEDAWGTGNRETWRRQLLSRDSLLWSALRGHHRRRRNYARRLGKRAYAHLTVVRLRSPREAEEWLRAMRERGEGEV